MVMKDLKRMLVSALMLCIMTAGALALGDDQRDQKRDPPPKEPKVIVQQPKDRPQQPREQPKEKPKDDRRRPDGL